MVEFTNLFQIRIDRNCNFYVQVLRRYENLLLSLPSISEKIFKMDSTNDERKSLLHKKVLFPVILVSSIVCQLNLATGISYGYSSILLSQLKQSSSSIHITTEDESLLTSLVSGLRICGALIEGYLVDKLGRKNTLQITSLIICTAWLFTYLSENLTMLYLSRIIQGVANGMVICVQVYLTEICNPKERSKIFLLISPTTMFGSLLAYLLGYLLTWPTVALICACYVFIIFFMMFILPESYIWYMIIEEKSKAIDSLTYLRRNSDYVKYEISEIEEQVDELRLQYDFTTDVQNPLVWKPFLIMACFFIIQQQTGFNIIINYASNFFSSYQDTFDSDVLAIIYSFISITGCITLIIFIHKANRKTCLIFSSIGMAIVMTLGAICLSFNINDALVTVCVMLYSYISTIGIYDIPWMMMNEVFPAFKSRGKLVAYVVFVIFISHFVCMMTYNSLNELLGTDGLFWYFSGMSFLCTLYTFAFLPETKEKSLFTVSEKYGFI